MSAIGNIDQSGGGPSSYMHRTNKLKMEMDEFMSEALFESVGSKHAGMAAPEDFEIDDEDEKLSK